MVEPYTSGDLMRAAVSSTPLDPMRVLATYADESNWQQVYADQRCYWSWDGPTITGYEFAQNGLRDAALDDQPRGIRPGASE